MSIGIPYNHGHNLLYFTFLIFFILKIQIYVNNILIKYFIFILFILTVIKFP